MKRCARPALAILVFVACEPFGAATVVDGGAAGGDGAPATSSGAVDAAPAGSQSRYAAAVLADTPFAYWRLGESHGPTAKDEVGGHPGTYNANCKFGAAGAVAGDTALMLGDNAFCEVDVGDGFTFDGRAKFSVEAWASTTSADSQCCFHVFTRETRSVTAGPSAGYALLVNSPTSVFAERIGDDNVPYTPIPTGQFVYLVLTFDGSKMTLYINGNVANSASNMAMIPTAQQHAFIGSAGAENFFHGVIDEVAVYKEALSPTQVAAHYQAAQ